MSGLHAFRSQLAGLKSRRSLVRWQTAIARGLVLDIIGLFAVLSVDFVFRLETVPRLFVILLAMGVLIWRSLRHIVPDLSAKETIVDMALLLERTHHVDSDLVAALQFDASGNACAGSRELQQAVIDRTARLSETLDFRSAVPKGDARRASWRAAIAVLFVAACWLAFPNHASAFLNRLLLGDARYPTRTRIDEVTVNGRADAARVVEGEAVVFRVMCSGVAPNEGVARLRGLETGDSTSVKLKRVNEKSDVATYAAIGPALNEPVEVLIHVGDAESQPLLVALIRRPLVELTIEAAAPAYMQREIIWQHERYVQVMEGSAVSLSLRCTNGKRLTRAGFELMEAGDQPSQIAAVAFAPAGRSGATWRLDAHAAGLNRVVEDTQFRVAVVDEDGLETYHPIEGTIRVKPDRAPTATLATLHHAILPNARPAVSYAAEDDFGVRSLVLHLRLAKPRDTGTEDKNAVTVELPLPAEVGVARRTAVRAEHILDLSPLALVEGDKLLAWLETTDYRGDWNGVSAVSETIELEVTDQRGVLDAILRSDADAEQMLTDVIEKELGLRGDR